MTAASDPTLVGTFASQHDAEAAKERLEKHGITPVTIEDGAQDLWTVHAPLDRRDDALAELQILEQRRRGPGI